MSQKSVLAIISALSLSVFCSGAAIYAGAVSASLINKQETAGTDNSSSSFWGSQHEDDDTGDSDLTKVIKGLLNNNSLTVTSGSVSFTSASVTTPINVLLDNVYMDFNEAYKPVVSGTVGLNCAGGSVSKENIKARYEDGVVYFTCPDVCSSSFKLTCSSLMDSVNVFKKAGVIAALLPETSKSTDMDLSQILSEIKSGVEDITKDVTYDTSGNATYSFGVSADDVTSGNMTISNINLLIQANATHDLSLLKTSSPLKITSGSGDSQQIFYLGLNLSIQEDAVPAGYSSLSEADKDAYESLDNPLKGLANLPSDLDLFQADLDASIVKEQKETHLFGRVNMSTGFKDSKFDIDKLEAFGDFTLYEPVASSSLTGEASHDYASSLRANHKLEISYDPFKESDGSLNANLTAEYRDTMHLQLKEKDVEDIYNKICNIGSSNVLYKYTKSLHSTSEVTSLPIKKYIDNKDFGSIEDKLIKKVSLLSSSDTEFKVKFEIGASLIDDTATSDQTYALTLTVQSINNTWGVTGVQIQAAYSGMDLNISLSLTKLERPDSTDMFSSISSLTTDETSKIQTRSYTRKTIDGTSSSDSIMLYSDYSKSKFISMDYLPLFVQIGLNTTENSFYYLNGSLTLSGQLFGLISIADYSIGLHAEINIDSDGQVTAYLAFCLKEITDISDGDFYSTEFFIDESGDAYICHNSTDKDFWYLVNKKVTVTHRIFKVTRDEVLKNFAYYVVDLAMGIKEMTGGSLIMEKVYSSMSGDSQAKILDDYENWISEAIYDSANRKFTLGVALSNIISLGSSALKFKDIKVEITHSSATSPILESLSIYGDNDDNTVMTIISILILNMKLQATFYAGADNSMPRYHEFINYYKAQTDAKLTSYFEVTGYDGSTANNNGNYSEGTYTAKKTSMSTSDAYFFKTYSNNSTLPF